MRQRWQDWEDRVLDELREFTNGSVTTIGRLMETVRGGAVGRRDREASARTGSGRERLRDHP